MIGKWVPDSIFYRSILFFEYVNLFFGDVIEHRLVRPLLPFFKICIYPVVTCENVDGFEEASDTLNLFHQKLPIYTANRRPTFFYRQFAFRCGL
jgi:hypothetical protein